MSSISDKCPLPLTDLIGYTFMSPAGLSNPVGADVGKQLKWTWTLLAAEASAVPMVQPDAVHCAFRSGTVTTQAGLSGSKFRMVNCCGAACELPQNPASVSENTKQQINRKVVISGRNQLASQ
jgi:hypothetical protein